MKIKITALRRNKRVYYFNNNYGVLRNSTLRYHLASGAMVVVFAFGMVKVGSAAYANYSQGKKKAPVTYQRQTAEVDTSKKSDESSDKLKNAPTKAREDEQLAKDIKSKLKNVPGGQKWSVYVRDMNSDRMASIGADETREAAGLGNLFMTMPLEAKLPSKSWGYKAGQQTVANCVQSMISSNDSGCISAVSKYANLKNANSVLSGLGFKKTNVTPKEQQTTARETGDLLFRLQSSQVLSDKARRVVFDGLYGNKMREGIPAGCDQSCLVANITGENGSVRHDAGIVTVGQAKYVVVVMTQGASWSQIADVAAHIRTTLQP